MRARAAGLALLAATALGLAPTGAGASIQEGAVSGPEAPDAPRTLTLDQALAIATGSNPEYRQTVADLGLAGPQRQQAIGAFLPDVSLSLTTGQSFVRQSIGTDDFGRPIENPNAITSYNSSSRQGLSFSWNLFDGLQRFQALREQEAQVVAWTGAANARLAQLSADVELRFFEAQLRRDLVEVEEELLRVRRRVLDATERLFALANKSQADVLGARVEVERQDKALRDQRAEYRKALLLLREQMGDAGLGDFEVADAPLDVFDPSNLSAPALVSQALDGSPEILRERAGFDLSQARARSVRGTRWPRLSLSGDLGRSAFGPDQSSLFDMSPSAQSGGGVALALSWDVFDGFDRQLRIAQADVEATRAQEGVLATRLRVEREVRAGLIDLQTAYASLEISLRAQEASEERLRLTGQEYQLAAKTFEELQDAVSQAAEQARAVIQDRFAFIEARVAVERAIGARVVGRTPDPDPEG